jgi:hypothetical protein
MKRISLVDYAHDIKRVAGDVYETGDWVCSADAAQALVGGCVYLHESKNAPAYFGGTILSWRTFDADPKRVVFVFKSDPAARGVRCTDNWGREQCRWVDDSRAP